MSGCFIYVTCQISVNMEQYNIEEYYICISASGYYDIFIYSHCFEIVLMWYCIAMFLNCYYSVHLKNGSYYGFALKPAAAAAAAAPPAVVRRHQKSNKTPRRTTWRPLHVLLRNLTWTFLRWRRGAQFFFGVTRLISAILRAKTARKWTYTSSYCTCTLWWSSCVHYDGVHGLLDLENVTEVCFTIQLVQVHKKNT